MEVSDDFNLSKILTITKQNEKKGVDIVNYHYRRVVNRIKRLYEEYSDHCYYDVDTIIPSLPLYDANDITEKLVEFMKSKGFQCRVIYQNKIFIYWKPKERKKEYIPIIYKMATKKIENCARDNKDSCIFEVPVMLMGYHPWYNASDVAIVIGRKLSKKGFIVKINPNSNIVNIEWNVKKIERKTKMKIDFKTMEEKRKEAMEKINYINEQRYVDFVNPKKAPTTNDNIFLRGLSNLKNDVQRLRNK